MRVAGFNAVIERRAENSTLLAENYAGKAVRHHYQGENKDLMRSAASTIYRFQLVKYQRQAA